MGTHWGSRLATARKKRQLSQAALAKLLGVSSGAVGHWETERNSPDPAQFKRIAEVLHVDLNWLLTGRERIALGSTIPGIDADALRKAVAPAALSQLTPQQWDTMRGAIPEDLRKLVERIEGMPPDLRPLAIAKIEGFLDGLLAGGARGSGETEQPAKTG